MIKAWQKGYKGFWIYWLGDLYKNGYTRDFRRNTEIAKLQKQLQAANSFEERELIEREMDNEREISDIEKKHNQTKRNGPVGLKRTRPGLLHPYTGL